MSGLRSCTIAIAVLLFATPLIAQTSTTRPDTMAVNSALIGPAIPPAILIDHVSPAKAPSRVNARSASLVNAPQLAPARALDSGPTAKNKALMVVGGAGLLVGAVVGGKSGTLIMGASGVVGLIGLWNYLK